MSKSSTVISLRVPNELLEQMPNKDRSQWLIGLIRDNLNVPIAPDLEARVSALEEQILELSKTPVNTGNTQQEVIQPVNHGKRTTTEEREKLIRNCYNRGLDYKETATWLNENGYLAQRGEFTPNSVRSIAKRAGIS